MTYPELKTQQEELVEVAYKNGFYVGQAELKKLVKKILDKYYPKELVYTILREINWKSKEHQ